jgi:hypothetical protein
MPLKGVKVVVNIATFELGSCKRSGIRTVGMVAKTRDRHEAEGLHIVTTLKTVSHLVKLVIISEMGMTTKEGNGSVPSHTTDGLENGIKLGRV